MAAWIQLLLTLPAHSPQQATKDKSRGTKRKSMTADHQSPSMGLQLHASFPSAVQIKHCTKALLQGQSTADRAVSATVQQVLLALLSELESSHGSECAAWSSKARELVLLAQPEQATASSEQLDQNRPQGSQPHTGVVEAAQQQTKLLQSLQSRAASRTSG